MPLYVSPARPARNTMSPLTCARSYKPIGKRLSIETGLPVSVAEDPLASVVLGTGKMLSDFDLLKRVKWDNSLTSGT